MAKIKIIFTDLDGTILPYNGLISQTDVETFQLLKQRNIINVIATGRSLNSLKNALSLDFPIDYAIFSSGAGIINWQTQEMIKSDCLSPSEVIKIIDILLPFDHNFLIYDPIPHNHYFQYHQSKKILPDFHNYLTKNEQFSRCFQRENFTQSATEVLTMLESLEDFNHLKELFRDLKIKIIRATSPIDHQTIWMEFFKLDVSKGNGANFLCQKLAINPQFSVGIGNDFNDLDLLNFTYYSYVVDNAPSELKQQYQTTASLYNHGFSQAIRALL